MAFICLSTLCGSKAPEPSALTKHRTWAFAWLVAVGTETLDPVLLGLLVSQVVQLCPANLLLREDCDLLDVRRIPVREKI